MEQNLYTSTALMGTYYALGEVPNFWLTLAFGATITFEEEYVDFGKVAEGRELAPLVMPMAEGRPIYDAAETRARVKPAYVKPRDPVSPASVIRSRPGLGDLAAPYNAKMSPQQRFDALVVNIQRQHREAIDRREEWMAANAILNGSVTLGDAAYPERVVDFGRSSDHTVVLGSGSRWGDANVEPLDDLEAWIMQVEGAKFGGPVTDIVMGTAAAKVFRQNDRVKELLKTDIRNTSGTSLNLGVLTKRVQMFGMLNANVRLWVYSDYYTINGVVTPFMDPRDILVFSPNVEGVRCYGAILDLDANLQAVPVFPKMWKSNDPSALMVMHQSAPLMVPVNPNSTLRARVVAN